MARSLNPKASTEELDLKPIVSEAPTAELSFAETLVPLSLPETQRVLHKLVGSLDEAVYHTRRAALEQASYPDSLETPKVIGDKITTVVQAIHAKLAAA